MTDNKQIVAQKEVQDKDPSETGAVVQLPEGIEPSLDELFNRNPLEWNDADLDKVILHMRKSRHLFKKGLEEGKKGKDPSKTRANAAARKALKKPLSTLNLDDLGLGG